MAISIYAEFFLTNSACIYEQQCSQQTKKKKVLILIKSICKIIIANIIIYLVDIFTSHIKGDILLVFNFYTCKLIS